MLSKIFCDFEWVSKSLHEHSCMQVFGHIGGHICECLPMQRMTVNLPKTLPVRFRWATYKQQAQNQRRKV